MDALLTNLVLAYLAGLVGVGYYRLRIPVLSALLFVAISLNAIPWDVFQFDVKQIGVKIEAAVLVSAIAYSVWEKGARAFAGLLNPYLFLCLGLGVMMAVYLNVSEFIPYGVEKTVLFFFKCIGPVIVLCMLAPFSQRDYLTIALTLIFSAFLLGINSLEHTDVMLSRAGEEMNLGSITIARIIGMGLFLIVVTFRQKSFKAFIGLPISAVSAGLLIYLFIPTGSRGPLASAILASIPVLFFRTGNSRFQRVAVPCVALFFFLIGFSYFQHTELADSLGFNRLLYIFQDQQLGTSELARLSLQDAAIDGFISSHGLGLGTGGYASYLGVEREWPHNMPLEILSELGLPGILLFLIILGSTVWRWLILVRTPTESTVFEDGILSLWLYFFLNSLVSYDINSNFGFWVTMAFPWLVGVPRQKFWPWATSKEELPATSTAQLPE